VQVDRIFDGWRQRRLAGACWLTTVEALDVPKEVVRGLEVVEEGATLHRPADGHGIVSVQPLGQMDEVSM